MTAIATFRPRFFTLLMALISLFLLAPGPGQAADRDRLEAFLEVTGFDVALNSIALSAEYAPEMLGMQTSDFGENWRIMAEEVFDTEVMHDMALDILEQTLSDDLLTHAAGFYASDLGQRLVEVENASHMVEDDDAKRAAGEALVAEYGTEPGSRGAVLIQLNEAVDSAGTGVRAIQELQIRFLMAASHAGVLENEIDEGALRAVMKEGEAELRESLKESSLASAAYTYRDIPDDDVAAYRDALREPQMQQVYQLMNAIQHEVMANRFEVLADRMAGVSAGRTFEDGTAHAVRQGDRRSDPAGVAGAGRTRAANSGVDGGPENFGHDRDHAGRGQGLWRGSGQSDGTGCQSRHLGADHCADL